MPNDEINEFMNTFRDDLTEALADDFAPDVALVMAEKLTVAVFAED
jgi:hypothetical protein